MNGGIYVLKDNGELVTLSEQQYGSEDLLQTLLARYPSVLAGDQMNPGAPRRWVCHDSELVRVKMRVAWEHWGAIRENTVESGIKESLSQRGIDAQVDTR